MSSTSGFRMVEPGSDRQKNAAQSGARWQLARESVDKIRDVLSSVLGLALKFGYLITNPAEAVQLPPSRRGHEGRSVHPTRAVFGFGRTDPGAVRDDGLCRALYGLRVSEVIGLRWSDNHRR